MGNLHPIKTLFTPSLEQHLGLLEHLGDIGFHFISYHPCHPPFHMKEVCLFSSSSSSASSFGVI